MRTAPLHTGLRMRMRMGMRMGMGMGMGMRARLTLGCDASVPPRHCQRDHASAPVAGSASSLFSKSCDCTPRTKTWSIDSESITAEGEPLSSPLSVCQPAQ